MFLSTNQTHAPRNDTGALENNYANDERHAVNNAYGVEVNRYDLICTGVGCATGQEMGKVDLGCAGGDGNVPAKTSSAHSLAPVDTILVVAQVDTVSPHLD